MRNFILIVILFVLLFPALEIYMMFQLAYLIGWWLLAWLLLGGIAGWLLIQEESMAIFGRLAMTVQNGQSPFVALWESGRTLLAAVLLIFPGVLSDVIALVLLLWPSNSSDPAKNKTSDDGVIEGEVRVVETVKIEVKAKTQ